jgi:glycosyltransferase involved in cell wall biosynthesis
MQLNSKAAILVASRSSLSSGRGGVQQCTQEYIQTLKTLGFRLEIVSFGAETSLLARLRRRVLNLPYRDRIERSVVRHVTGACRDSLPEFVFFNQADVLEFSREFRECFPIAKLVLLSHGLESADYLHELRARGYAAPFARSSNVDLWRLGFQLKQEATQRFFLDASICLSPVEVEIERWLGTRQVTWLPRTASRHPLNWSPAANRVGYVGTLDHPPNAEGLILVLRVLLRVAPQIRVRVVGGPEAAAKLLFREFPNVDYLGVMGDNELRDEGASWNCFLHPLFCFARGASTKLATGLSWEIPVVATVAGCRGYRWKAGGVTLGESPVDFANQVARICADLTFAETERTRVQTAARTCPSIEEVAEELGRFLSTLSN